MTTETEIVLRTALKNLLNEVDRNTCVHDDTYRGGFIWTICRDCGRKWADDQGGFVPHEDSAAVKAAREVLDAEESPFAKYQVIVDGQPVAINNLRRGQLVQQLAFFIDRLEAIDGLHDQLDSEIQAFRDGKNEQ